MDPEVRGAWKAATGRARIALYALVAWGLVMSIPSLMTDWRLPLIGLRVDFLYVPLVVVGYVIARDRRELTRWVTWLGIVTALACSVGLVQATIGPEFLRPSVATPGLDRLELTRYTPDATEVFRPVGTFVEPGRFLSMALVGLTISLGAMLVTNGRRRLIACGCVLVNLAAVWTSGGRTGVLWGAILVLAAALAPAVAERRPTVSRAVLMAGVLIVSLGVLNYISPSLISSRAELYATTLDPGTATNEWGFRWESYTRDTLRGISFGGLLGTGTGSESLGRQYIHGGSGYSAPGLYLVEAGYGSIAVEWGLVGLALWLCWTIAWTVRMVARVVASLGDRIAAFGVVVIVWFVFLMFIAFYGGIANFQNYINNVFLWFLSGMVFALPLAAGRAEAGGPSVVAQEHA
jgi:O-antigen ligase